MKEHVLLTVKKTTTKKHNMASYQWKNAWSFSSNDSKEWHERTNWYLAQPNSENGTPYYDIITQLYTLVISALSTLPTTEHTQVVDYSPDHSSTGTAADLNIVLWKWNLLQEAADSGLGLISAWRRTLCSSGHQVWWCHFLVSSRLGTLKI